jgi:hypothetical protein
MGPPHCPTIFDATDPEPMRYHSLMRCTLDPLKTCYSQSRDLGLGYMLPMRRREFISLLGGTLAAQAIPANAQEPVRVRTVGV